LRIQRLENLSGKHGDVPRGGFGSGIRCHDVGSSKGVGRVAVAAGVRPATRRMIPIPGGESSALIWGGDWVDWVMVAADLQVCR
jgi:hypothetical protein